MAKGGNRRYAEQGASRGGVQGGRPGDTVLQGGKAPPLAAPASKVYQGAKATPTKAYREAYRGHCFFSKPC